MKQPKNVRFRLWFPKARFDFAPQRGGANEWRQGTLLFCSAFKGTKETSDENYNRHPRHNFPRRHFGSGFVSGEQTRAWAIS
jgi:hypothetical protein